MNLYTVRDDKAGYYLPIFEARSDPHVRSLVARGYKCCVPLYQYPKDYSIVRVGSFNDKTGLISPAHVVVCDVYTCLLDFGIDPDKSLPSGIPQDAEVPAQESAEDVKPMEDR